MCGYLPEESLPQTRSRRAVLMGALLTAISPLMAQSGRVRIRVTDAMGTVVPQAEASLSSSGDEPIFTARADEAGEIVLTGLSMGDARIKVTHHLSGFGVFEGSQGGKPRFLRAAYGGPGFSWIRFKRNRVSVALSVAAHRPERANQAEITISSSILSK